jgi:hypothetical protein
MMSNLFRSPLLHFLSIGAILFAVQGWRLASELPNASAPHPIEIPASRLEEMQRTFSDQMGRRPDSSEIESMIAAEVDEEILYREALARGLLERDGGVQTRLIQKMLFLEGGTQIEDAPTLLSRAVELGLHREDVVVRRILVQKMRLIGSSLSPAQRPSSEDIEEAYESERERLRAPDRRSLVHVFVSRDRRGKATNAAALALRERLVAEAISFDRAPGLGDPFPLGHRLERRSQRDLERSFGARFGASTFALPLGQWSDPIASAYGVHLVRIEEAEAGQLPPLSVVSDRLRLQLEERRRDKNLDALLSDLRTRYKVALPPRPQTSHESPHIPSRSQETG